MNYLNVIELINKMENRIVIAKLSTYKRFK